MNFKNLREFITFLEERGQLRRIAAPVNCELEITEIADRMVKQGGPALLFENVVGYDLPVLINMFCSDQRMAWALGVEKIDDLVARLQGMLQLTQGPPEGLLNKLRTLGQLIQIGSFQPRPVNRAPCQEVVLTGDDVDLFRFPALKCWPLDGGRYITLPLVITKDPGSGVQNYGMYRMQIYDARTTGMHWQTHKVGAHHYRVSQEREDNRLEVAVAIGADPATMWTGSAPLPPDMDEMAAAGFIRQEGVELVKAKTVDLLVPAHAEIVLEGYVLTDERRSEGPFGDHTGYYSMPEDYPVFHVKPSPIAENPSIPRPLSAARPWKTTGWAKLPSAFLCRSSG